MAIYDFFLSRNGAPVTAETYVGHVGRLFYESSTGEIRISDGATAGGLPIPITIATSSTVGSIRPGAGFSVAAGGILTLNAGPMFELDGSDVFQLKVATETQFGGVKLGPGVTTNAEGQIIIDSEGLDFSFGDFASTVGTYSDSTSYAVLSSINPNEDIVFASNGTGSIHVVGEFKVHPTNGDLTSTLETTPAFTVQADGQVIMHVIQQDAQLGAVEIIGSSTGDVVAPGINGTMLHITGQIEDPCRVYIDGNGDYVSLVARRWNGNFEDGRTAVLANDDVLRINATAQTNAGMGNVSMAQIRIQALENQTTTAQGSKIIFTTTPIGSPATSRVDVASITVADGVSATKFTGPLIGNASTVTNGVYITDTATVTNTMLAGSIANNKLANSTISGIALGSSLAALSAGNYLTGTDYNGGIARTFAVDATTTNTASKVVARDASGNFAAGTITADLTGTATTATNLAAATSILAGTLNVNPPAIGKNGSATATYTLTGLTTNHKVVVMPEAALPDEFNITASWASAANTLSIQYQTYGGGVDAAAFNIAYWAWV